MRAEAQGQRPFYEGKTIIFIISTAPGGTTDIAARLVGRHLGKHIAGRPELVMQNMPGAGGIVAANHTDLQKKSTKRLRNLRRL